MTMPDRTFTTNAVMLIAIAALLVGVVLGIYLLWALLTMP